MLWSLSPNGECVVRLLCDRCDFSPFLSALHKSQESPQSARCLPLRNVLQDQKQPRTFTQTHPTLLATHSSVCYTYARGLLKLSKLPTFSAQGARHSEQHGPDKHQTSRRLHLLRRSARLIHTSKVGCFCFTVPDESRNVVSSYFTGTSCSFPNLSGFLPWILCLLVVKAWQRAGAEARSREGLSGEWQVESAPPSLQPDLNTSSRHMHFTWMSCITTQPEDFKYRFTPRGRCEGDVCVAEDTFPTTTYILCKKMTTNLQ